MYVPLALGRVWFSIRTYHFHSKSSTRATAPEVEAADCAGLIISTKRVDLMEEYKVPKSMRYCYLMTAQTALSALNFRVLPQSRQLTA